MTYVCSALLCVTFSKAFSFSLLQATQLQMSTSFWAGKAPCVTPMSCLGRVTTPRLHHVIESVIVLSSFHIPHACAWLCDALRDGCIKECGLVEIRVTNGESYMHVGYG